MRLAFLIELVLAAAVGFGCARAYRTDPYLSPVSPNSRWRAWAIFEAAAVLTGVGVVLGLGAWAGAVLRRGPARWGGGRRVLAAFPAYVTLETGSFAISRFMVWRRSPSPDWSVGEWFRYHPFPDYAPLCWFLLALGLTALASRPANDPAPDAREWAGRAFAVALVLSQVASWAVEAFDLGPYGF